MAAIAIVRNNTRILGAVLTLAARTGPLRTASLEPSFSAARRMTAQAAIKITTHGNSWGWNIGQATAVSSHSASASARLMPNTTNPTVPQANNTAGQ